MGGAGTGPIEPKHVPPEAQPSSHPHPHTPLVAGAAAPLQGPPDRFEIRGKLGAGGMGVVYRAFDRERGQEVALKVLRQVTGRDVYRFKREFRALADVAHPNLVGLYELHLADDEWFLTMELVDGVPFIDWVRPDEPDTGAASASESSGRPPSAATPRGLADSTSPTQLVPAPTPTRRRYDVIGAELDVVRLQDALYQLCDTVHALHQAGKLHRDLKPANVLVDGAGRVVLLDFGLIADVGAGEVDRTHELAAAVGTPAYMSPEQAADRPLSWASDWYAVGVMLYEALTGRRPIDILGGNGPSFDIPLPPPDHYNAAAPAHLAQLCMALLAADPERRPDGAAVLLALGREPSPASRELALSLQAVPFVGRERELEALRAAFRRSRTGRGVAVFVRGESGMGKSALVRRFLDELGSEAEGAVLLRGRCYERESVPFKTLDTVVDALTSHLLNLPRSELVELLPRDVEALGRLFPATRRVPAIAEPAVRALQPPDPLELRRRAFGALRVLLGRLAAQQPVVIALDDLQWGDADSGNFLAELLLHHESPPILLVLAHRSEDEAHSPLLLALRRAHSALSAGELVAPMDVEHVTLEPLSNTEARMLVRAVGGGNMTHASEVVRDARGSPLFVAEMVRAGAIGPNLDDVVRARLARLSEPARALAHLCAVAAHPLRLGVAMRAAGVRGEGTFLATLRSERLLRVRRAGNAEPELEMYHDRIRAAAVAGLDEDARRRLQGALAAALEQETAPDREALVTHWLGAEEPARAATHAALAAAAAEERLAFHRAADLYALVLAHGRAEGDEERALRTRMGHALVHSGRLADAAEAFATAATTATATAERFELRRLELEQRLRAGQLEQGVTLARELLEGMGTRMPSSRAGAIVAMLSERARLRLRGIDFEERPASAVDPQVLQRIDMLHAVSNGLSLVNPAFGRALQTRLLREALACGEPHRVGLAFCLELGYLGTMGGRGFAQAETLGERTVALGRRTADSRVLGHGRAATGLVSLLNGRWTEAYARAREGEQLLRDHGVGVRWELNLTEYFIGVIVWHLGNARELVRLVSVYLRDADERGDAYAQRLLRGWRTNVAWLVVGRPDEARAQLASVERSLAPGESAQLGHYYQLTSAVSIDLYQGDGARAHERVTTLWKPLERAMLLRVQSVLIEIHFLRVRAALTAAAQDPARRPALLREISASVKRIEAERMPWGLAFAATARAGVARLNGDVDGEADALRDALARFDTLDMSLYAAAVRRRLGSVLGGDAGRALAVAADDVFHTQAIADPEALSRVMLGAP